MEIPKEEGFVTIVEGNLLKKILKEGEGEHPKKGQLVSGEYFNLCSSLQRHSHKRNAV
jgi:FKBP-type peptidyl-prolyl cis-trans isomerase